MKFISLAILMTLHITENFDIPEETKRVASIAFPKGHKYMKLRDEIGTLFKDEDFQAAYSKVGQPGVSPWRLAIVTILQHAESLSDREAADAVRSRIDWKYLLGLELTDSGFDYSVLSDFRRRLVENDMEEILLDKILDKCKNLHIIKKGTAQRSDSTHILASVRKMSRCEVVAETLRALLNEIAKISPDWLRSIAKDEWYDRYNRRIENYRLPQTQSGKDQYLQMVGEDSQYILNKIYEDGPDEVQHLDKLGALVLCFTRHFEIGEDNSVVVKSHKEVMSCDIKIESPYDIDARYRTKRDTSWIGYMTHFTETCDKNSANIITNVITTTADIHDVNSTSKIHDNLKKKDLLPKYHIVDSAYISTNLLVTSQIDYEVGIIGHVKTGNKDWRRDVEGAYTTDKFQIDWENKVVICPEGKKSSSWNHYSDEKSFIKASFTVDACWNCLAKEKCIKSPMKRRTIGFPPQDQYEAKTNLIRYMETEEGLKMYDRRAGIEGTISQATRTTDARKSKYVGLKKTHLQQVASAAAINIHRIIDWITDKKREETRESSFSFLQPKAA